MRAFIRLIFGLALLYSFSSHANWNYQFEQVPAVSSIALQIETEVELLPSALYLTQSDHTKVSQLLHATQLEIAAHSSQYQRSLNEYTDSLSDETWFNVESHYLSIRSLSVSKEKLLSLAPNSLNNRYTGFGPEGVIQFRQELWLTKLNSEYLIYFQLRSFQQLLEALTISPIPVIWALSKVIATLFVLLWWLRNSERLISGFRHSITESSSKPPFWKRVIWYLSRANIALAWLIAITVTLRILASVPSLQHLELLEIFTWWVMGGSIVVSFVLEFVHRHSRSVSAELTTLRLSTIRRYVWSVIVAGVILQLSVLTIGKGTIYTWITSFLVFWFVLVSVSVLRMWRNSVYSSAEKITERPIWVAWSISQKERWIVSIFATLILIVWLSLQRVKQLVIAHLSEYQFFSQALAYLFRIEVEKQTHTDSGDNLERIRDKSIFNYVLPGSIDSQLIDYAQAELSILGQYLLTDSPAVCVLSAERGAGATTALRSLLDQSSNAEPIYLNCPYAGYQELITHLAVSLGLDEQASEVQILAHLRKSQTTYLIAIDNAQRLVKPMVGGLKELIKMTNLLRRSRKNHRVVFSIEKSCWRFVDRARGERLIFDMVTFLPKWTEKQIGALLDTRINKDKQYQLSFEGLVVPKQWDYEELSEEERARNGFYRILWHYSDGNPTIALRFFRFSLHKDLSDECVYVRLFNAPESQELENMPKPMLAVLRSIVQLEIASPEVLSDCTQLTIAEVTGVLRYFQSRGYIEWSEDKARLSDHWFRHITNVLDRQHLLVK